MLRTDPNFLDFEDELGAIAASASISVKGGKKKKKKKVGAKVKKAFKKIGKVAAVVATGGLAAAPMIAKKTKLGKKVIAKVKGSKVASKVKDLLAPAKPAAAKKPAAKPAAKKPAPKKKLPAIAKAVLKTSMSECSNVEEMAKLVAAKLMVTLGKPLQESNRILAKQDLQNQATYEHKKLMTDADFRRKVLALLAGKAAEGNETCQRTVKVILAK